MRQNLREDLDFRFVNGFLLNPAGSSRVTKLFAPFSSFFVSESELTDFAHVCSPNAFPKFRDQHISPFWASVLLA